MAFEAEAVRGEGTQVGRTGIDLEDAVTDPATKVMMMVLPGDFIPARRTREKDLDQPGLLDQTLDVAVDRRDSQARDALLRDLQGLRRRQRSVGAFEGLADRHSLLGVSMHILILAASGRASRRRFS